jgi:putative endonuclease
MNGYVYVLKSLKDNGLYIGSTTNIKRRINQHNKGLVRSTKGRRPLELKYVLIYDNIKIAARMEKRFKRSHNLLLKELKKKIL